MVLRRGGSANKQFLHACVALCVCVLVCTALTLLGHVSACAHARTDSHVLRDGSDESRPSVRVAIKAPSHEEEELRRTGSRCVGVCVCYPRTPMVGSACICAVCLRTCDKVQQTKKKNVAGASLGSMDASAAGSQQQQV